MRLLVLVTVVAVFVSDARASSPADTVRVEQGLLSGTRTRDEHVRVFKGIPYAAPPVGTLRWRPPQPAGRWRDVRAADQFSAACMQEALPQGSFYQVEFVPVVEPTSEDCLYLNVWAPAGERDAAHPVMVWIHGGGFTQGSGTMPSVDGAALAARGVVLVTFNYRLGVFGLFAHPELTGEAAYGSSGNYGLLDQVAALRWVQRNIAAFDGDPTSVTLFGQSSGAGNVNTLMTSPTARGLFHRAILQSGSVFAFGRKPALTEAEQQGKAWAEGQGMTSVAALRDVPADTLLARSRGVSFMPNVDGWLLPEPVDVVFARGDQADVPMLVGSNANEGTTLFGPGLTAERYVDLVEKRYGDDAAAFLDRYPAHSNAEAKRSFDRAFSDEMAWGAQALATTHVQHSASKAFVYHFTRIPPGRRPERYGAFHSAELAYVFGTLDTIDRPWTDADRRLSHTMMSLWTSFAAKGNPNGPGLPTWPVYVTGERAVLMLGDTAAVGSVLDDDLRTFYRRRWARKYGQ